MVPAVKSTEEEILFTNVVEQTSHD
jgi:hypothetical protein